MTKSSEKRIAGILYDEWLDKAEKKAQPIFPERKYSSNLIAFVDVLGIKKLIADHTSGNEDVAIDKIEEMRKIVDTSSELIEDKNNFNYLHISDSFVFICKPDSIILLIELLSTIQTRIIQECKFLLRGAVTMGDAIVREEGKFIIGPAYIKAYQLQEKDAIYPRIIVDKSAVKAIEKKKESVEKYLKRDADKEWFIDYIKVCMARDSLSAADMRIRLKRDRIFDHISRNFKDQYEQANHNIAQKYGWTMQYCKALGVWEDGQ